jgi:hypothetical protein
MLKDFLTFIQRMWRTITRRRRIGGVQLVESRRDLPNDLGAILYIVGKDRPRWVVLNCPCGCGERANAKIGVTGPDSWTLSTTQGRVSLSPSFSMSSARCRSHFFIRENRVIWV